MSKDVAEIDRIQIIWTGKTPLKIRKKIYDFIETLNYTPCGAGCRGDGGFGTVTYKPKDEIDG